MLNVLHARRQAIARQRELEVRAPKVGDIAPDLRGRETEGQRDRRGKGEYPIPSRQLTI